MEKLSSKGILKREQKPQGCRNLQRGSCFTFSCDRLGNRKDVQSNCISLFEPQIYLTARAGEKGVLRGLRSNLKLTLAQSTCQNTGGLYLSGILIVQFGLRFINWQKPLTRTTFRRTERQNWNYILKAFVNFVFLCVSMHIFSSVI